MKVEIIDMRQFIPVEIDSVKRTCQYITDIEEEDGKYRISYVTPIGNATGSNLGKKTRDWTTNTSITLNNRTLTVLGLLQGEMSKTDRRQLTFCNSEPGIMSAVLSWFETDIGVTQQEWYWYIKVNLQEPAADIKQQIESEVIAFWEQKCSINKNRGLRKMVSYISGTANTKLRNNGTLIIEKTGPLFTKMMHIMVKKITHSMPTRPVEQIIPYMQGIIAAEGCVNYRLESGHRRVFITACNDEEREIFSTCLHKLGIETKDCKPIKDIVISGRKNILLLQQLGLMTLHPEKNAKFEEMCSTYIGRWPSSFSDSVL
jgi:hypothetical protein